MAGPSVGATTESAAGTDYEGGRGGILSEQKRQRLFEHQEALRIHHLHQQRKLRRQQQTEIATQAQPLVSPPLLRMAGPLGAEARGEDLWSPGASMDDSSGSAYAFQSAEEAKPISTAQTYGAATLPVTQMRLASSTPVTAADAPLTPLAKVLKRHEVAADDPEQLEYFHAVDAMQKNQSPTFETLKSFAKARKMMDESRVDRDLKVKVANDYKGSSGGNTSRRVVTAISTAWCLLGTRQLPFLFEAIFFHRMDGLLKFQSRVLAALLPGYVHRLKIKGGDTGSLAFVYKRLNPNP